MGRYFVAKSAEHETARDTTIYDIEYRDTVIYNIAKKDSTITDFTLVPIHDTILQNDTIYVVLPLSSYHFYDSLADIYVSGYNVTLDNFLIHRKEVLSGASDYGLPEEYGIPFSFLYGLICPLQILQKSAPTLSPVF